MESQISLAAAFAAILVFGCVGDAQSKGENIFPNQGFDEFEDDLPTGWTVNIWNKPLSRVETNRLVPGRDGTGHCLEITPSTPMASVTLTTQAVPVSANRDYLFKGYYASASVGTTTDKKWMDAEESHSRQLVGRRREEDRFLHHRAARYPRPLGRVFPGGAVARKRGDAQDSYQPPLGRRTFAFR